RFLNCDAKEVWTFVVWVVYAGDLHARAARGWSGTRSAWLDIVGFFALVVNYTVVDMHLPSLHFYAGCCLLSSSSSSSSRRRSSRSRLSSSSARRFWAR